MVVLTRSLKGSVVYGCVYFPTESDPSFEIEFTVGGASDNCMNDIGYNSTLEVSAAGVLCTSVGYVEEKGSSSGGDTCATDLSIWGLSYNGNGYSGSTLSEWSSGPWHNEIQLYSSSPGTNVCASQALCQITDLEWDVGTTGPIYVGAFHATSALT